MITFSALPIKEFYEYAKICSKSNKQTEQYDLWCANLFTCFLCDVKWVGVLNQKWIGWYSEKHAEEYSLAGKTNYIKV